MPFEEDNGRVETGSDGRKYKYDAQSNAWNPVASGTVDASTGIFNTSPEKLAEIKNSPTAKIEDLGKTTRDLIPHVTSAVGGFPGDVANLIRNVTGNEDTADQAKTALERAGKDVKTIPQEPGVNWRSPRLPTSPEISSEWEKVLNRPLHEPQNSETRFLQTAAETAPTAMLGGPESIPLRALTRVVAPAAVDEAVRALTKDSPIEGPARIGSMMTTPFLARRAITPIPRHNPGMTPSVNRLEAALEPHGGELPISAKTGSGLMKGTEALLGKPPRMNIEDAFTKAAMQETGPIATEKGMGAFDSERKNVLTMQNRINGKKLERLSQQYNVPQDAATGEFDNIAAQTLIKDPKDLAEWNQTRYRYGVGKDIEKVVDEKGMLQPDKVAEATKHRQRGDIHVLANDAQAVLGGGDEAASIARTLKYLSLAGAGAFGGAAGGIGGFNAGQVIGNVGPSSSQTPNGTNLSGGMHGALGGAGGGVGGATAALVAAILARKPLRGAIMNPAAARYLGNDIIPRTGKLTSKEGIEDWLERNIGMSVGATANERNPPPE